MGQFPKPLAYGSVATSPEQIHHHRPQKGKHRGAIPIGVAMDILTELHVAGSVPFVLNAPALLDQFLGLFAGW